MNKIRLLLQYLLLSFLFIILVGCSKNIEKPQKTAKSISLSCFPTKLDYISSETLMLNDGKIAVLFDDGTTDIVDITNDMYDNTLLSSLGENTVTINYSDGDNNFSTTLKYYVHSSKNTRDFVVDVKALPYLNEVTTDNSNQIIDCYTKYDSLSSEESSYIDSNFPSCVEKINHLQNYILPAYNEYVKNKVTQDFNIINKGAYDDANYQKIVNYVSEFQNKTYSSLIETNKAYDDLILSISKIEKNINNFEEYKANTINTLKSLLNGNIYIISENEGKLVLSSENRNYFDQDENKATLSSYFDSIEKAADVETVDMLYMDVYPKVKEIFVESYKKDCLISIQSIYGSLIKMEDDLITKYSKDAISVNGLFNNINISFLDDNRWWIPTPYKICTIINEMDLVLQESKDIDEIKNNYSILCDELMRATLQKNIELFYSIHRNLNKGYDTTDYFYWNNLGSYSSASVSSQFVYNGIFKKYNGETYGSSNDNSFRFSHVFYGPSKEKNTSNLLTQYYNLKTRIAPPPLKITNISISPLPTTRDYYVNDELNLAGGKILVEYNDLSTKDIDIESSMLVEPVDMSSAGNKEVKIKYIDSDTTEEKILSFYINVLSNTEPYYNDLIIKISALDENSTIADVNEIYVLLNNLDKEKQDNFKLQYEKQYSKLLETEKSLMSTYTFQRLNEKTIYYETINYYNLTTESQTAIDTAFNELFIQIANASSFADADLIFANYDSQIGGLTYSDNDLDLYKSNTIKSIDRICEVSFYDISGSLNEVSLAINNYSLKTNENISPIYADICNQINSKTNKADIDAILNNLVPNLYENILSEYAAQATLNVKNVVENLRNTVKEVWINKISNDNISINGESGSIFSSNYSDDSGYYAWYTPEAFKVNNVKSKIAVNALTNKKLMTEQYNKAFYEMFRATCYRNLFTVFFFNTQHSVPMAGGMWSTLYFCDPGFYYDGTIEEYQNQYFDSKSFRLWRWGWSETDKCNNINDLLYHYNYDLNLFMTN